MLSKKDSYVLKDFKWAIKQLHELMDIYNEVPRARCRYEHEVSR